MPLSSSLTKSFSFNVVAAAILCGILTGFGLSTIASFGPPLKSNSLLPSSALNGLDILPPLEYYEGGSEISLDSLQRMVAHTNGFYARDYSLWLGWNNMRYIIEAAFLHGRLLNRTTIIPSFVYARACEFDIDTCAGWATMVNRGDAVNSDEWRDLPMEQQMAWRIPISLMFNLTHLRRTHAFVTVTEYLRMQGISAAVETGPGNWDIEQYHHMTSSGEYRPSLSIIANEWYDPGDIIRVDSIPDDMKERGSWTPEGGDSSRAQYGSWGTPPDTPLRQALMAALPSNFRPILSWEDAHRILQDDERITPQSTDEEITDVLRENGFEVVYTYSGAGGFDAVKDVVAPSLMAVPRESIQGLYDDFSRITAEVLLVRGETHWSRKPGFVYFTTPASRTRFTQTVLYDVRLTDNIINLAWRLRERLVSLNDGRHWVAAHMRRGDFVKLGWAMEADFKDHLARIQRHLNQGRSVVKTVHDEGVTTYPVPDVTPDLSLLHLDPPLPGDKYYIATDERDPDNLAYLREQGGVVITDIITLQDRREFGWAIMLTDILALLEQALLSHAAFFYAHVFSSVAGGVMNLRASAGADPRTAYLD